MANEESFKYLSAENCNILHVATHGFYLPTDKAEKSDFLKSMPIFATNANGIIQFDPIATSMLRSGLAFAGGNKAWKGEQVPEGIDDGIATSAEIANISLAGTDLIVLSACETGLGEVNDEGVFGLQRAFKKAGANTIIMSLWKVNDHITQMMMTSFYGHLLSGKTKRDSFRLAQQEIRAEYPNPYQWAAFIMLD
jgi:CHAT domain-containing protein